MRYILFLCLLASHSSSWLAPVKVTAEDSYQTPLFSVRVNRDKSDSVITHHSAALRPKPELYIHQNEDSLTFNTKTISIDGQSITRSIPMIDGLPVEGADGIFDEFGQSKQFFFTQFAYPEAEFRLNAAEAVEYALRANQKTVLQNPYVERIEGLYERLWLLHFGDLRPVFKVRLPTLSVYDLKDIYVDAQNGDILRIEDSAQFAQAPANVFVYSPSSPRLSESELKQVMLPNLLDLKEDGFLSGEYVSVRTCCRYYTCPSEGECTDDKKRCALKSHANAQQSRELLSLPTDTLGLDALVTLPPVIHVDTVRCTYLPFARAGHKQTNSNMLGFFEKPIDQPGIESEMDRFSEVQAYFSIMSFFNNIRALLNDKTWCLRPEAMSCNSDGSPVLDEQGKPKNPYRAFVNQLIPDMKVTGPHSLDSDNFIAQAQQGKGERNNPVVLNDFVRFSNAAFIPALSTLKKSTPRADEILSDLIKPFDHNVFFQGDKDFAYDGDVVFHEFMHAITTSLISKINSLGLDKWGIHSEPGGLNEAWSDYFAAAFTNDPKVGQYANVQNGYGEVALRNIENNASCPADVMGEIHNDGLIWSGALWEIRTRLKNRLSPDAETQFDRAVLASLSQAKTTEDFKSQSEKLINNLKQRDGLGEPAAEIAEEVFKRRGVRDCFRAVTLSSVDAQNQLSTTTKSMLFVPSKNQIGLKNYAPSAAQLEIGIPAGAKNMTLTWKQFLGATGALLGTETTPDTAKNMVPLSVITHLATPIVWNFNNAQANPTDGKDPITTPVGAAHFENGAWHYTMPINFERCEQNTLYVSLLSNDFKYVLQNLSVEFDIDKNDNLSDCDFTGTIRGQMSEKEEEGCASHQGSTPLLIVMMVFILGYRLCRRESEI